ncbi:unnamed protein product [Ixodes hexagonus]
MAASSFCLTVESVVDRECITNLGTCILNSVLVFIVFIAAVLMCSESSSGKRRGVVRFQEHNSRWILTFCAAAIHLFELADGVMILVRRPDTRQNLHPMLCAVSSLATVVVAIYFYHKVEAQGKARRLSALLVFWPCVVALKMAKLVVLYEKGLGAKHMTLQTTWAGILVYALIFVLELSIFTQKNYFTSHVPEKEPDQEDMDQITYRYTFASMLSKCTFYWLVPLLKLGARRPLELGDLGYLPEKHMNENQYMRFNKVFSKEKARTEQKGGRVSLWCCYLKTYWKTAMTGGLIKVIGDVVGLLGPLSISLILEYVEEKVAKDGIVEEPIDPYPTAGEILSNGYIISVVILAATFMQSTCSNNFNHMAIMESVHVRSALQSLVYRKSLRIASDIDVGLAVNHMSVDSFNVMLLFSMGHYIWAVPFKLIVLLILLYKQLGYSALVGAATIYVLSPLQYWVCTKLSKLQKEALTISDKRIKHTSELLQGIKLLKLHGWEKVYANMVKEIRAEELKILRKDAIFVAINTFITQGSAILLTLVTFSVYSAIEGRPLTPAKVFSGLALFNQLTVPLYIIPFVIPIVINSVISTKRLSEFLSLPEVGSDAPWRKKDEMPKATVEFMPDSGSVLLNIRDSMLLDKWATCADDSEVFLSDSYSPVDSPAVINMNHAYFTYDMNTRIPILQDMNFTVPTGKLTIIVGPVGSGKTTLLSGMLGELTPYQGTVQWANIHCIAYVPQKPWLLNSTLKENVLFGQRYDGRRYHQVIQACALQPDIDLLPAKEMTEIGERGINLSGGQRQRIALARAMYSPAKTIILDDPLSALDSNVAMHVFEHGIRNLLLRRHRTVILVTHKQELLIHAFKVIILEGGKIRCQGNLSEIERMEPDLTSVLSRSVKRQPVSFEDNTTQERHKLMRMITKQTLYLSGSNQDIRPRPRMAALNRQLSHDPSSPLPLHDMGNEDASLMPWTAGGNAGRPPSTGFRFATSGSSAESVRSAPAIGNGSPTLTGRPWLRCPPSRLSSRISNPADLFIEEEEEEEGKEKEGNTDVERDKEDGKCWLAVAAVAYRELLYEPRDAQSPPTPVSIWMSIVPAHVRVSLLPQASGCTTLAKFLIYCTAQTSVTALKRLTKLTLYKLAWPIWPFFFFILSFVTSVQKSETQSAPPYRNFLEHVDLKFEPRLKRWCKGSSRTSKEPAIMLISDFKLKCDVFSADRSCYFVYKITALLFYTMITHQIIAITVNSSRLYREAMYEQKHPFLQALTDRSSNKGPYWHFSWPPWGLSLKKSHQPKKNIFFLGTAWIEKTHFRFCVLLLPIQDYLGGVILFLATMAALTAALTGSISPSFVGIAMTYTLLVPIYLNWLVRQVSSVEMYMSSVERVIKYAQLPIEHVATPAQVPSDWPSKGEVRFEKVTMRYETGLDPVLKNISVTFAPGEKVGICGRTGSGKSSLVMGLFKMVPISEGTIYVDGIDIATVPFDILRSRLSIIPQEPVLFSGTIRQNLDPRAMYTDEQLWSVLEKARLKEVVIVSGGLDGEVTEEGSNFSIGQRQLFCFARSLLQPSKVFVLDEATSSLDSDLDSLIQETILNEWADSTILAIAHRVTGLLNFDRVIVLEAGHIVETGAPSELRDRRGSTFVSLLKEAEH